MRVICRADPVLQRATLADVAGNLDFAGSEAFLSQVTPCITSLAPTILLDLTQVEWVTSAGIGALVRILARTQQENGGFAVTGCGSRVRHVLRICGLEEPFNVRETLEEGRARLLELGAR